MSKTRAPTVRIGVDLGGTKIEAIALDLETTDARGLPKELARVRVPTERTLGYEHVVETTRDLVHDIAKRAGIDLALAPIGVGMPGSVTRKRDDGARSDLDLVKNSNTTCLNGRPFHDDLARAVGRPIAFANDANCFALAEATWGAARGARVAFGIIMGTGVGGGVVVADGLAASGRARIWNGKQGIAGEWGHVVLDPLSGPPCYCGRRGCIETYLGGPALEAAYAARSGIPRSLSEIAESTDPIAKTLLAERVEVFGRALATVIDILDPDVVVLGGGVSKLPIWHTDGVRALERWIFNDALETKLVQHALGDSAGVLGAALLPG